MMEDSGSGGLGLNGGGSKGNVSGGSGSPVFKNALGNFVYDVVCKRAIRHLYDEGLSVADISTHLSYPVSDDVIRQEIAAYEDEKARLDRGESVDGYVCELDDLGRKTYRRVKRT